MPHALKPAPTKRNPMELALLDSRDYTTEVKDRIGNDELWGDLLDKGLIARTRWTLVGLIESLDEQEERALATRNAGTVWLQRLNRLKSVAIIRLKEVERQLGEPSALAENAEELAAWSAFAAQLARELDEYMLEPDPLADYIVPGTTMTAREWLARKDS